MKKLNVIFIMALAFTLFTSVSVFAGGKDKDVARNPMPEAEMKLLVDRLEEIKTMDRSMMTRAEKKDLRSEVREINEEIKRRGGGVYLSVFALLIVIALLILLL
jgi:hypothetical protein